MSKSTSKQHACHSANEQKRQILLALSSDEAQRPPADYARSFQGKGDQRGWTFKRIGRAGNWFLYEKQKLEIKGAVPSYEVVRLTWRVEREVKNTPFKAHWHYPSPEEWQTNGYSFCSESKAREKLRELGYGKDS